MNQTAFKITRFPENPIIYPELDSTIGDNINGPSIIKVPKWIEKPLGKYYLYFAHHSGDHIRMAYADDIQGPWEIYEGGVLHLKDTFCQNHIASPDVHICFEEKSIRMYFHGVSKEGQRSYLSVSEDGIHFNAFPEVLGPFYFKCFQYENAWYAMAKRSDAPGGGVILRSEDGKSSFEQGQNILHNQRHVGLYTQSNKLYIFFTRGEDSPERILLSTIDLSKHWQDWKPTEPVELMRPEKKYEGAHLPIRPSEFGAIREPAHELRDPTIFKENNQLYILYSGAGESNICGAELIPY